MYIKKIQFENMLIVEVKNGNVEQALKKLKNKVRNVKQVKMLRDRQEFTKPSVSKRLQKQKAKYIQKLKEKEGVATKSKFKPVFKAVSKNFCNLMIDD